MGIEGRRSERDRNFYSDLNNDTTNEEHDHKCNFFEVSPSWYNLAANAEV